MQHPNRWFLAPVLTSLLAAGLVLAGSPPPAGAVGQLGAPACTVEQLTQTEGDQSPLVDVDADGDRLVVTSQQPLDGGNIGANVEAWLWSPSLRTDASPRGFHQLTETQAGTTVDVALSDDGQVVGLSSTANLAGFNADGNPEVFSWDLGAGNLEQQTFSAGGAGNQGIAVSGDGSTLAWHSDRNLVGQNPNGRSQIFR